MSEPRVTLHLGDALDVMARLPDESIDSIVIDPPYCSGAISEAQRTRANGQGLRSENLRRFGWFTGDNMGTAGLVWLLRSLAFDSRRIVRSTGSLLVFCDWRMVPNIAPAIESAGLRYQDLVVWDKGSFGLGNGFRKQHELAAHFTYGSPEYHDRGTGNVLTCPRVDGDEREHQAQKPVNLLARMVEVVCPVGGTVLDAFMGSGSTGVACVLTGRNFVGIEQDPAHHATARRRIDEALIRRHRPHAVLPRGRDDAPLPLFGEALS